MAEKSPLRRWKPFFPAFGAIDASIEAAVPKGCSRDRYRQLRGNIVEILCDVAGDDDDNDDGGRAEGLCRVLDAAMAEALETLRVVPVTPAMLTTTDVAKAVGGLLRHESERVRGLARAVLSGWTASIEAALGMLLQISREHEVAVAGAAPPVTGRCVRGGAAPETALVQAAGINQAARISDMDCPNLKKMRPGSGVSIAGGGDDRVRSEQTTAGDAKHKHRGAGRGCKAEAEADDVKRQQREVPETVEVWSTGRSRKMEPAMKSRSPVSTWRSTDERHS